MRSQMEQAVENYFHRRKVIPSTEQIRAAEQLFLLGIIEAW